MAAQIITTTTPPTAHQSPPSSPAAFSNGAPVNEPRRLDFRVFRPPPPFTRLCHRTATQITTPTNTPTAHRPPQLPAAAVGNGWLLTHATATFSRVVVSPF